MPEPKMPHPIDRELERCQREGETVALACIVGGSSDGRLLIWPSGQAMGDLGSPRLNQRVALYAEGLLARGGAERKRFDGPGGGIEVDTTVFQPADDATG